MRANKLQTALRFLREHNGDIGTAKKHFVGCQFTFRISARTWDKSKQAHDKEDTMHKTDITELMKAVMKLEKTFEGDSNDAEHDAAVELVDTLRRILNKNYNTPA